MAIYITLDFDRTARIFKGFYHSRLTFGVRSLDSEFETRFSILGEFLFSTFMSERAYFIIYRKFTATVKQKNTKFHSFLHIRMIILVKSCFNEFHYQYFRNGLILINELI